MYVNIRSCGVTFYDTNKFMQTLKLTRVCAQGTPFCLPLLFKVTTPWTYSSIITLCEHESYGANFFYTFEHTLMKLGAHQQHKSVGVQKNHLLFTFDKARKDYVCLSLSIWPFYLELAPKWMFIEHSGTITFMFWQEVRTFDWNLPCP